MVPIIEARMAKYQQESSSEIRFNLMGIVKDRALVSEEGIASTSEKLNVIERQLNSLENVPLPSFLPSSLAIAFFLQRFSFL